MWIVDINQVVRSPVIVLVAYLLTLFEYLVEKMIPGAKKRGVDGVSEDRMSNLPRELIDKILDHMHIVDAGRTSILSKTLKNIWETHPNILLGGQFILDELTSSNKDKKLAATAQYIGVVNSILLGHVGPILQFSLYIPAYSHLHDSPYPLLWIKQLPEKGVRILELYHLDRMEDMPSYFFSCSDLTGLCLVNWKLNPPHNFRGFRNLTTISLRFVVFTTDMLFGTQVQRFQLWKCAGIEYLDTQLTNHGKNIKFFDIVRSVTMEKHYALDYDPRTTDIKKSFNLRRLLGSMPSIETLVVDATSLVLLDPGLTLHNHLTSTMKNLKTLKLRNVAFNYVHVISNAFCLLRSMPILEHLEINVGHDMNRGIDIKLTAEQYMESHCADITLNQLQNVTMHDFLGSRAELLFTKLLLASSPSLKRMTFVRNTKADDPRQDFRIARELMQFPRKSPVQIFWS